MVESTPSTYDLLEIPLRWELDNSVASRSFTRIPVREIFYHDRFLKRSENSIAWEFAAPKIPITKLPAARAEQILNLILDTSAVRYRELYGFTFPTAQMCATPISAEAWTSISSESLDNRKLIRDYHAGMYFKNGVPIGYVELLSSKGVMEVGFNLYYTFRESESAFLYARLLKIFHERLGARSFTIDPYQIGHENEEAVESGAFWFYRKLGFQSTSREAVALIAREESKIAMTPGYRTPPKLLRKIAEAPLLYKTRIG